MPDLDALAERLAAAADRAQPTAQLSDAVALTLPDAYAVQRRVVDRRAGARVGLKMGFTSRAKMAQMGVSDLICGELTDDMRIMDGGSVPIARFIHPRVEPEIAFVLKAPLGGRLSPAEALLRVEAVAVAVEVIDSRYQNFRFDLTDVVADNSSSAGFALGPLRPPSTLVDNLGMVLRLNGRAVQAGSSAAILGDPARALAEAAHFSADLGIRLDAGSIVLAGAATAAEALAPGMHVCVDAGPLGRVSFEVGG